MVQIIQTFVTFTYLFRLCPTPAILSLVFFKGDKFNLNFKKSVNCSGSARGKKKTVISHQCFVYLPVNC